ncbi:hypothetical protein ACN38_g1269 [Penicillium nordicum]|uniref:Uncharacterized protein n=1 Tax=Penicillium nordicum TaxID=229535 RepID=A0A0M8P900_9EURO|nr:hypothetical protein ACN38_g1269 [Penicillium nordicum]
MTEWGPYEEALRGRPAFAHRDNIATGSSFMDWDALAFGTALLWRTLRDTDSAPGASGNVFRLGEPQHEGARALLFQNFEVPLTAIEHVHIFNYHPNYGTNLGIQASKSPYKCGPEESLGPNIYTAAATIGRSDCPYDLLAEWSNALM